MNFRVGQKVVCILDAWWSVADGLSNENFPTSILPVKGGIYTVARSAGHSAGYDLIELFEPMKHLDGTPRFAADGFRPVVINKTDISAFTRLLAPNAKILELHQ